MYSKNNNIKAVAAGSYRMLLLSSSLKSGQAMCSASSVHGWFARKPLCPLWLSKAAQFLVLVLFVTPSFTNAQQVNLRSLLLNVSKTYKTATSISMNVQMDYYSEEKSARPDIVYKGEVKIAGANYYSNFMGRQLMVNKDWMVLVDKNEKTISCMKPIDKQAAGISGVESDADRMKPEALVDSTLKNNTGMKLLPDDAGGNKVVEVKGSDPLYKRVILHIDPVTYALKQIDYTYNILETDATMPRVTVYYQNVQFNKTIAADTFSEKKYIRRQGKTFQPLGAWSGYKILDYTIPKTISND